MTTELTIHKLKHAGREKQGFALSRPRGTGDYVFILFKTPVCLTEGGQQTDAKPGGCILYTPDSFQHFSSPACDLVHDWFHFTPADPTDFERLGLPANRIFYPAGIYSVSQRINRCEREIINGELYWQTIVSGELTLLFLEISRELAHSGARLLTPAMKQTREEFKRLRVRMFQNPGENWDVTRMCAEVSLSRSRFTVLYQAFFGAAPHQELIRARMERAKYLLLSTEETVEQTALRAGYPNLNHFSRQFRLFTGVTPGEFRKNAEAGPGWG